MGATECQFCAIIEKRAPAKIVAKFDSAIAFFPNEPAAAGHTLVVPRGHVENIWSLDESAANSLMRATVDVSRGLMNTVRPDGLSIIQSNGEAATQTVPHVHVHIGARGAQAPARCTHSRRRSLASARTTCGLGAAEATDEPSDVGHALLARRNRVLERSRFMHRSRGVPSTPDGRALP